MRFTFTTIFMIFCFSLFAQTEDEPIQNELVATRMHDFGEEINRIETEKSSVPYLRDPKSVDDSFNGFKIQILQLDQAIEKNHKIFEQFGGITVEKIEGQFYYCIGQFDSIEKANDFTTKIIENKYPFCKIIEYQSGMRKQPKINTAN